MFSLPGFQATATFSANADDISQEGNEVVTLRLNTNENIDAFDFYRDELIITIIDGTGQNKNNSL